MEFVMMKLPPDVVLVGGPDVDARVELMKCLKDYYKVGAIGSDPALKKKFLKEGFEYKSYHLSRRINPISDLISVYLPSYSVRIQFKLRNSNKFNYFMLFRTRNI